jgi:hypothetical protein
VLALLCDEKLSGKSESPGVEIIQKSFSVMLIRGRSPFTQESGGAAARARQPLHLKSAANNAMGQHKTSRRARARAHRRAAQATSAHRTASASGRARSPVSLHPQIARSLPRARAAQGHKVTSRLAGNKPELPTVSFPITRS